MLEVKQIRQNAGLAKQGFLELKQEKEHIWPVEARSGDMGEK